MSLVHKDQHRSVKTVVQSRLSSPFKSRRQTAFSEGMLITPSSTQSECSTLVDFADDYRAEDQDHGESEDETSDETLLHADNCAWRRGVKARPSRSRRVPSSKTSKSSGGHAQMLDVDDMSWNMPKPPVASIPARILHALAGQ